MAYKYKLIKTYPGSAPLNAIFVQNAENPLMGFYHTTKDGKIVKEFNVSNKDVKDKTFFQEIFESPYLGTFVKVKDNGNGNGKFLKGAYRVTEISDDGLKLTFLHVDTQIEFTKTFKVFTKLADDVKILIRYFFINSEGKVMTDFDGLDERAEAHIYRERVGNYFKTREEAQSFVGMRIYD